MLAYFLFFSLCVCPPALARPALFKFTLPQTPLRFASSAPWRRVRPFALPTSKKTKTQTFLKIRKMRTFRIFRFCPFDFCGKQVCKCLAFGRPHFIFRKIRTFRIFRFFWRALFFVENAAWSFAGAFPRWRGQIGVDPPSPRSDCP